MSLQTHNLLLGAPPAAAIVFPSPRAMFGATKLYKPNSGSTGGSGLTHCSLVPSEAPFTGGSIVIANPSPLIPLRIAAIAVAASAGENDGFTPVDGSGAAVAWTVIVGPFLVPPGQYLRPNLTGYRPGVLKIPFTCASIARSDLSGAPPFLMIRVRATDPMYAAQPTTVQVNAQRAAYGPGKRTWNAFWKSGDYVTTNQAGIGTPTQGYFAAIGVEFNTTVATKCVADVGDSTTQGAKSYVPMVSTTATAAVSASTSIPVASATGIAAGQLIGGVGAAGVTVSSISGTTVTASAAVTIANNAALTFSNFHDYNGPLAQWADTVSTLAKPVHALNLGAQGWTVEQFLNQADYFFSAGVVPHIAIIQPWSSNSLLSLSNQGNMDADYIRVRNFALKCQRSGIVALLKTPKPAALAASSDTIRKAIIARVKADIFPYIDSDAAVSDGGTPAKLLSQYDCGDGVHCNNAGYGQEASAAYTPALAPYLS